MDYKQFVKSTINRFETPTYYAVKKALVGEYITFSILNEEDITQEILSEKVCDYFEKLGMKTGLSLDEYIDKQFNNQIAHYLKTLNSIVEPKIMQTPKTKKNEPPAAVPRARKYYEKAVAIKSTKELSVRNLIDYSRIMFCLYATIVENDYKQIENFAYSIEKLDPGRMIDSLKNSGVIKKKWYKVEEQYSTDTCFFMLAIIMLYTIINDKVEGENSNE